MQRLIVFCFLLIASLVVRAADEPAQQRPNILLIVAEDMSPHVGAFGDLVAQTPNIDKLAGEGVRYTNTFTVAGVCAPSRSGLITGVYPQSLGTQHMRTSSFNYEAVPPQAVKAFPELLRRAGYVTANFSKRDYQFGEPFTVWDIDIGNFVSPLEPALWRQLPKGKPFFAMVNLMWTHESRLFDINDEPKGQFAARVKKFAGVREKLIKHVTDPADVIVPPYYPDTLRVRRTLAQQYDNIHYMDSQVGEILKNLEADGLAENTVVIWTTDHGDGFPRAKRAVYDSGLHVPMVIRFPDGRGQGKVNRQMVSFVDLAPTILGLAGADIPDFIQGQNFLGREKTREYVFAGRDRMDEVPDWVRAARDDRFKYIRNLMPEVPYFRPLTFRDMFPIMHELWEGVAEKSLNSTQNFSFVAPRPVEELYDTVADPYEVHNLAADPEYAQVLQRLRSAMDNWLAQVGDKSQQPEAEMIADMWPGLEQPVTAAPVINAFSKSSRRVKYKLSSSTPGASIGYRVLPADEKTPWQLYTGTLELPAESQLEAKAIRYGYKESAVTVLAERH